MTVYFQVFSFKKTFYGLMKCYLDTVLSPWSKKYITLRLNEVRFKDMENYITSLAEKYYWNKEENK